MRSIQTIILAFFILTIINTPLFAQGARPEEGGRITARIIDEVGGGAIEYANVVLHRVSDSTMVAGTVSDREGRIIFDKVAPGTYYLAIHFIGYEDAYQNSIHIRGTEELNLGDLHLKIVAIKMGEVEVNAERAPVEYQIDKKVINVDRQLTAASGTAVDALQNVPSVTVDLDGTVRLRGSGSFTVLIDGQPSALEASEALQQIPASSIQNIEIITNPSARYDPDGMAGIINVIMKKDAKTGTSGLFNLSAGTYDNYRGDFLLTMRKSAYSVYFGADYGKENQTGTEREERQFISPGSTLFNLSDGSSHRRHKSYGFRGGLELPITDRDNVNLGLRYGDRSHSHGSELDYEEYTVPESTRLSHLSIGDSRRGGAFYAVDLNYRHRFETPRHELSAQFALRHGDGEETSTDELLGLDRALVSGRSATEDGPGSRIQARVDYVLPFNETDKLEAGYQASMHDSKDITTLSEYNAATGVYDLLPQYGHSTDYYRDVQAMYSMYAMEIGDWGMQAGLRGEFTDRRVTLEDSAAEFSINRWDLFPSVHMSYGISATEQIMASYTRRIDRPRGWYLEPFLTWSDAFTVRRGNPDLKPEYIDSYELGFQTHLGSTLASAEVYHRATSNKVEFVRSVYRDNITLRTVENVGQEFSTGVELMFNANVENFWDVYLLGNLYDYRVEGELSGISFAEKRFTWNIRFNNTFSLAPTTVLQANASYNSPSVSAQGRTEGYVVVNAALRQEFFGKKLSAILDVSDILHTGKRESTAAGPDFTTWSYYLADGPMLTLTLRYSINNGNPDEEGKKPQRDNFGTEEF
ncbi:MAG: TonB-dependent receptor [Bacteroidetes bacterium]|nr:TonB-dependent receptor [Bacteroidota bacterium]